MKTEKLVENNEHSVKFEFRHPTYRNYILVGYLKVIPMIYALYALYSGIVYEAEYKVLLDIVFNGGPLIKIINTQSFFAVSAVIILNFSLFDWILVNSIFTKKTSIVLNTKFMKIGRKSIQISANKGELQFLSTLSDRQKERRISYGKKQHPSQDFKYINRFETVAYSIGGDKVHEITDVAPPSRAKEIAVELQERWLEINNTTKIGLDRISAE